MTLETSLLIGGSAHLNQNGGQEFLNLKYANRHGLVAGATGTGKTVTLQVLAEGFSQAGTPVFVADVKGDLSGISQPGKPHPKVDERVEKIGIENFKFAGTPTMFWDVFGEQGQPIRLTISDMGPVLLARLLELNDTQEGVLTIAFQYADDNGLLLLDFEDLEAIVRHVGDEAKELQNQYGNISAASVGAIQRRLLGLKRQGAEQLFGEPALDIFDLMKTDSNGKGFVNILAADKLIRTPKLYAMFLLWLLSELFEVLPEVGDPDKPKLVFFFDEAHLLFDEAPKALIDKVEQVVRLIRSKGVGVYFVTQSPQDVPVDVLGQLGNRVQHALRAFTPKDQKAVRSAAETFRPNPELDTEQVITQLGVGEALVSCLQDKGMPGIVQRTLIKPPSSRIGPASEAERQEVQRSSPLGGKYDQEIDRDSAHEMLQRRLEQEAKEAAEAEAELERREEEERRYQETRRSNRTSTRRSTSRRRSRSSSSSLERIATKTLSNVGKQLVRGLLGSLLKGR